MAQDGVRQKVNKYCPDDFESQEAFLSWMVQTFNDDVTADYFNIQAMLEDAAFVSGQQWDPQIMSQRILDNKPCLTINTAPAFVAQVMGNRYLNETAIRVLPDTGGTKDAARVRQGLIRSIEKNSNADRAYNNALQNCVIGGLGNFRIELDYADNDVFEQDIKVRQITNPGATIWSRLRTEPTGRDSPHVFVQDLMLRSDFQKMWPWAQPAEFGSTLAYTQMLQTNGWVTVDMIRVVSFWRMRAKRRTLAMLDGGKVVDVTDMNKNEWLPKVVLNPSTQLPMIREVNRPYAEMVLATATNILEGPYRLWIDRVPVFRVPGWEINVGDTWQRFGLIRFAKDPMRLRNYWRSTIAERLMMAAKAGWMATKEAVMGHEHMWRNSHLTNDPLLIWNGESGQKPERIEPPQVDAAMIEQAGASSQDIKDVTNLHEANLGITSNEVSGKALIARQRVGELGTVIYQHNLNLAIGECGRVMNDLIPYVYDTARTIKVLGEDGKAELVKINDPTDAAAIDITVGKYSVTTVTGPSYATRRQEAVDSMEALFNAAPDVMGVAADLMVENMDWPGAEAIAGRLKKRLPPDLIGDEELTPEQQQQRQQEAAVAQQQAQFAAQAAVAELEKKKAEAAEVAARVDEIKARTALVVAQTEKTQADADKSRVDAESTQLHDKLDAATTAQALTEPEEPEAAEK